jgi:hypothetical protein
MERREMNTGCWWGNLKDGGTVEDLGVDWRINIKVDLKKGWESLDWIEVAEDRDKKL